MHAPTHARLLVHHAQRYNCTVTGIDKEAKVVTLESGAQIRYNSLLSTLPLDVMLRWFGKQASCCSGSASRSAQAWQASVLGKWVWGVMWSAIRLLPVLLLNVIFPSECAWDEGVGCNEVRKQVAARSETTNAPCKYSASALCTAPAAPSAYQLF
eukprot:1152352-Pelagomonas_calceolata.AAC.9